MIALTNVDFSYGRSDFRLRIDRLSIEEGTKVAVIGPSGSGKTTFLNLLAGIAVPATGSVQVGEHVISLLGDKARRALRAVNVGFVFQDFGLLDYLDVLDNVLYAYHISRALRLTPEVRDRARRIARDMGLAGKLHRHPDQLSQGEKQRAAICRALLPQPRMLLADEPTGSLDPSAKLDIVRLLSRYADESRATLIMVTHDHGLLGSFDRVVDLAHLPDGGTT